MGGGGDAVVNCLGGDIKLISSYNFERWWACEVEILSVNILTNIWLKTLLFHWKQKYQSENRDKYGPQ